jgi:hypothetical protein
MKGDNQWMEGRGFRAQRDESSDLQVPTVFGEQRKTEERAFPHAVRHNDGRGQ